MPNYPAIPEPSENLKTLTDVARAMKETLEVLTRQSGSAEDSAVTVGELAEQVAGSASTASRAIIADALDDRALDTIFDRAAADAEKLVEVARADATAALSDLQVALDNFLQGYADNNAVVNVNIETLQSEVDDNTARITTEEITRATETTALSGRIDTISASTDANTTAITDEAVARANADSAIGVRISAITATNTGVKTFVQSTTPTATATGQYWIDTANNNLIKKWTGTAWQAPVGDIPIEVAIAATGTESISRVTADSSLSTRIDTLVSTSPDGYTATINGTNLATASRTDALATTVTSVQALAEAGTADGYYRLTALANPTDGAGAEFSVNVKSSSAGAFAEAGMRIQAFSSGENRVKFSADRFIISNSTANFVPFAITSGQLVSQALVDYSKVNGLGTFATLNTLTSTNIATYIETAAIGSAYIASVDADKINANTLSAITADLGTITAGYMQSTDGKMVIDLNNKTIIISD